jgi:hypothetical protein
VLEFIDANQASFPTAVMCRVLGVSASGYYEWRRRPPSARAIADGVLAEEIKDVHGQSRQIYGYRRITAELLDERGECVGRHRVARLMRAAGSAGPGQVLVSGAVPPLVAGSGLAFEDLGKHELKGVPGSWRLFAVKA